jgi:malonyl-CoA/methylmalonyl-CoA synthetase
MIDELSTPEVIGAARTAWSRHLGVLAADGLRAELGEGSIAVAAHETALRDPSQPALQIDEVALTHGQLDQRAARMAGWLGRRGLRPDDVVLISGPSSLDLVVAYLGALRAGMTVLLANPAYTEAELDHLVGDSRAVAALAAEGTLGQLARVAARHSHLREVVDLAGLAPAELGPGSRLADAPALDPLPVDRRRPAILAYTSGTTGKPKAVPLTDANVLSSIRAVMLAWRWSGEDVLVHSLPLFHQHGLGGVHATLLAGSSAVIQSRFDPRRLCGAVEAARASVLFAVPSIYARLAEWEGTAAANTRSLRLLISGSAPLSPPLAQRMAELVGQLPLERYGTTESGLDVSNPYAGERLPGTVGLALPGIELAIAGPEGQPLHLNADGEIVVRGPQVFGGYRGAPDATAEAFYPGGWFRTGDIGRIDAADGYLRITGRARELIISGGMNIYPREVEFALEAHPAVARAAVVGVSSERWGEEVVAAVVPAAARERDLDDSELLEFARTLLAPYKCPKRVLVVPELPVNAMGKTLAPAVRQLFEPD